MLVLGADSPIGLTVVRELGARGVPVTAHGRSDRALGRFSRYSQGFVLDVRPLAQWLAAYVAQHRIGAVMAVSEGHLIELAPLKSTLGDCRVLTPDAAQLAAVLDKARTLALAAQLGLAVPTAWQPLAGEDHAALAALQGYPVAIKWADPNAVQRALDAAGVALEKVEYARNPAALLAILARYDRVGAWPLVQQYCPGQGLGQMLHMAGGTASLRFQHRRLREYPPSGGVSAFCEAVPPSLHSAQMERSEALLKALGWQGPAMVEYRFDAASGTYWLMEVNGRLWGSLPLAWHCGAEFAWETYRSAMLSARGQPGPLKQPGPFKQRRARYVIPDAKALVLVLRDGAIGARIKLRALVQFGLDFLDPRVRYYVWSLRDPGPLVGDLWGIVKRFARPGKP